MGWEKRNNNFFGTTINLASRIASAASPGKFLCSSDFVEVLKDQSLIDSRSSGMHSFKNLSKDRELYELSIDVSRELYIDPVCRMVINDIHKALAHPHSPIYFCSNDCYKNIFGENLIDLGHG